MLFQDSWTESMAGGSATTAVASPAETHLSADVLAAQQGDAAAFERLYRANVSRVFAVCVRMSGDRVRAEELTQDVFVRAWEKLETFRGNSSFSTWLHRLAVNVVLGGSRTANRRRAFLSDDETELASVATKGPPAGLRLDLERAIATLPEGSRTVFVLYDVEGYSHAEIAEMTGRSEGTSKSLLSRARMLLRAQLQA